MRLSLIVLRSLEPARLAEFYGMLGLELKEERHGDGPLHFAGAIDSGVIEIYPTKTAMRMTFGLTVPSMADFRSAWVAAGGTVSDSGLLADPDGNKVYGTEGQ